MYCIVTKAYRVTPSCKIIKIFWNYCEQVSSLQIISLQNKCRTVDPDRQNLGRSGKLPFCIIYEFWQNCASVCQVSDLILKTEL